MHHRLAAMMLAASESTGGGGGGGTIWDDDFSFGASIDTTGARSAGAKSWVLYNDVIPATTFSANQTGGILTLASSLASYPRGALEGTLPSADWKFRAKVRHISNSGSFPFAGIALRESSTDKVMAAGIVPNAATSSEGRSYTAGAWGPTYTGSNYVGGPFNTWFWVEVERLGANVNYRVSDTGADPDFDLITSQALTTNFTLEPDQIGVFIVGSAMDAEFDTFWKVP